MAIQLVGLNHATAPVALREQLAFSADQTIDAYHQLTALDSIDESLVLSTCNRSEIYCVSERPIRQDLIGWLCRFHCLDQTQVEPHLYYHVDADAVRHLLRVASGLDSMVLGEPEILGQVKSAYQQARSHNSLGARLNRLLEVSFSASKEARSQTAIGHGSVSVAATGVKLAHQVFARLSDQTALLIGAGETIELTARHLQAQSIGHIIVANRTHQKARALAERYRGAAIELDDVDDWLPKADLVFSSTSSSEPLISKSQMERSIALRKHKPVLMVDFAVPRDLDERINELEDVFLFTLDHIQELAQKTEQQRLAASEQAESLLNRHQDTYMQWLNTERQRHALTRIRQDSERVRDRLLADAHKRLAAGQPAEEVLAGLASRLTRQLMHQPTVSIREAIENDDQRTLETALALFLEHKDAE